MGPERFWRDQRAVSVVIGAILIFGIVIMSLASYQAFVVPVDNAEAEFEHFERVQGDMLDVRNTILTTKTTGDDGFVTVELGTQLPQRMLAVNPPNPTGVLETSDPQPIRVYDPDDIGDEEAIEESTEDTCGIDDETRSLTYTPNYREFDGAGLVRYENSVLYTAYDDAFIVHSGQELVRDGVVTIVPLTSSFFAEGHERASIEPRPGRLHTRTMSDPIIEVPTLLDEDTWIDLLEDELDFQEETVEVDQENQTLRLELSGSYRVRCEPIGIDEFPEGGARAPDTRDINPVGEGTIQLIHQDLDGPSNTVELIFQNRGDDATVEEARINFATSHEGGVSPEYADIYASGEESASGRLVSGGDWVDLEPAIEIDGTEDDEVVTTSIEMEWNDMSENSWYVLSFLYDTGDEANYFIGFAMESPLLTIIEIRDHSDDEVFAGETALVEALVYNEGASGTAEVDLLDPDGNVVDSEDVTLQSGETTEVTLTYETSDADIEDSPLDLEVASEISSQEHTLEVIESPEEAYYSVTIVDYDEEIVEGQDATFEVEVTNVGETDGGEQDIVLEIDGVNEGDFSVTLNSGESQTETLTWTSSEAGSFNAVVLSDNDTDEREITVQPESDATVEVFAEASLSNNEEIDTSFSVERDDDDALDISILIEDTAGGGSPPGGWATKEVTFGEETFELTEAAADDIAYFLESVDLFDAENYEDADQSTLDDLREGILLSSDITDVQHDGDEDLHISLEEVE